MTEQKNFAPPKVHGQGEQGEGALTPIDVCDRLHYVMAELLVVSDAVAGSELETLQKSGLQTILHRQIDEIRTLETVIHPPKAERHP